MQKSDRATALYAALKFVTGSSALSEHRGILIDVLLQALQDEGAAVELEKEALGRLKKWQDDEIALFQAFLKDRVARNWQEADENVMYLATKLQRDPRSVREKATDMGLGVGVDYTIAKAHREEPHR